MAKKIAVLISGGGTNLQSLIDRQKERYFNGSIELVVSNNAGSYGLERARQNQIESVYLDRKLFADNTEYDTALIRLFQKHDIDLIVLAGYLRYITPTLLAAYPDRVINIHPSLLPAFGGKNFYGLKVHQAVYQRGTRVSGATVHFVDSGQDTGPIILQKAIPLDQDWQPEEIQRQVLKVEHELLPEAVRLFCEDLLVVEQGRVRILAEH